MMHDNPVLDLANLTKSLSGLNSLGVLAIGRDGRAPINASQWIPPGTPSRAHMAGLGMGEVTAPADNTPPDGNPILDNGMVIQGIPQDYYQFTPTMQLGIDPPYLVRAGFGGLGELGCAGCSAGMGDLTSIFDTIASSGWIAWAGLGLVAYLLFFGGNRAKARRGALQQARADYRASVAEIKDKYART